MDLGLQGRMGLIVGATGGIGRAVCRALAEAGMGGLSLAARSVTDAEALASTLNVPAVHVLPSDLMDPAQPEAAVEDARSRMGRIDVAVLCAGDSRRGDLWQVGDDDWHAGLHTKLLAGARLIRAAAPDMMSRGWGRIVLVAGLSGRNPAAGSVIGGVVNAGLANLATAVAKETGRHGVTVNVVDPHFTRTPRWNRLMERVMGATGMSVEDAQADILRDVPGQAPIPVEHVADATVFLLSDRAASINGTALAVDHGAGSGMY